MNLKGLINPLYLLPLLLACNFNPSASDSIISTVESITGEKVKENYFAIVIINQNTCPSCNKAFSDFISQYSGDKNILFLITANSSSFDISPYLTGDENIYFDEEKIFFEKGLVKTSTVLMMNKGRVDSVLEMTTHTLESNMGYLANKLKLKKNRVL